MIGSRLMDSLGFSPPLSSLGSLTLFFPGLQVYGVPPGLVCSVDLGRLGGLARMAKQAGSDQDSI